VFEDPPIAISSVKAFSIVSSFTISLNLRSASTSLTICSPAFLASSCLLGSVASIDPFPGSAIPRTSERQFIEFAVNIPEQEPQEGQAFSSITLSSFSVISPLDTAPTASKAVARSMGLPSGRCPAAIGPPLTNITGILSLAAAIIIPGTILSQLGMHTSASSLCASTTVSIESAISSLLGRE